MHSLIKKGSLKMQENYKVQNLYTAVHRTLGVL